MKPLCCSFFKSLLWPCLIAAFLVSLTALAASPVSAQTGPTYDVSINTSSLDNGNMVTDNGFLIFELNPIGSDSLPLTVSNNIFYSSDYFVANNLVGTLGDATYTPGTPANATLSSDQGFAFMDVPVGFGQQVNILTDFSGPAFAPGPNPPADGSTFSIMLLDGDLFPLLTSQGTVVQFNINGDGSVSPQTFPQADGSPSVATVTLTPESSSSTLFLAALAAFCLLGTGRAGIRWRRVT